jgi:hypothetical protein
LLKARTPQALLAKSHGLSLSDHYWLRPEKSDLKWEEINFFTNPFSEDIGNVLFGQAPKNGVISFMSPDIACDGWLPKRWKIIEGKRCLIKGGSGYEQEPCNEAIASIVMQRLGVSHVPYTIEVMDGHLCSVCENFLSVDSELVAAWHISQARTRDNRASAFNHFLYCCEELGIPNARESLEKMLVVDYLIANEDRHYGNFGAVRNTRTLEWRGLAPVYDSGSSLWHSSPLAKYIGKTESRPFKRTHEDQIGLVSSFDWFDPSKLDHAEKAYAAIFAKSGLISEERSKSICDWMSSRVERLKIYISGKG